MATVLSLAAGAVDRHTPELAVGALIDAVRAGDGDRQVLVELLSERHDVYVDRTGSAAMRIRGYVLAAFEATGLPDVALPYVLEQLENGREAYLVAAAARAFRGSRSPPWRLARFLGVAMRNIELLDDAVSFESLRPNWSQASPTTTALQEVLRTVAWMGMRARTILPDLLALEARIASYPLAVREALRDALISVREDGGACCDVPPVADTTSASIALTPAAAPPAAIRFEDQDGRELTYAELFTGRPSIVAFFYTRCDNPNKCSLTITKLARLQRAIADAGLRGRVRTAAITYDPGYDLPARLRSYGENRGASFDDDHRILRTPAGLGPLQEHFQLGVSFGPALVNRHRIELFVLDDTGRVAATFARLQWDVDEVLSRAVALLPDGAGGRSTAGQSAPTAGT